MSTEKDIRIRAKVDTPTNWKNKNPTLLKNELAYSTDNSRTVSREIRVATIDGQNYQDSAILYHSGDEYITWGGANTNNGYHSPLDQSLIKELGQGNIFAFLDPTAISIESSTDGGVTWTEKSLTDAQKVQLLTLANGQSLTVVFNGDFTSSGLNTEEPIYATKNDLLRITIDLTNENTPIYAIFKKIGIYASGFAATYYYATIEKRYNNNWYTVTTGQLGGWSNWSILNLDNKNYYGKTTDQLRITIGLGDEEPPQEGVYNNSIAVGGIVGYCSTYADTPWPEYCKYGHTYSFNTSKDTIFNYPVVATRLTNYKNSTQAFQTNNGVAFGPANSATVGNYAMSQGYYNEATGSFSSALGTYNQAKGLNAITTGSNNVAFADNSSASGKTTQAGFYAFSLADHTYTEDDITDADKGYGKYYLNASTSAISTNIVYSIVLNNHYNYQGKVISKGSDYIEVSNYILPNQDSASTIQDDSYIIFPDKTNITGDYCIGDQSHAEGFINYAIGKASHAEGRNNIASGACSHAEGRNSYAYGYSSHAESGSSAKGHGSHAEGGSTTASGLYAHSEGAQTLASGEQSHAEGSSTTASGLGSHAEGGSTTASGNYSHAEGNGSKALASLAHAEGNNTVASAEAAHAEGTHCKATAKRAHAQGYYTTASGSNSFASGSETTASGYASTAFGSGTIAEDSASFASGLYVTALGKAESVFGRYNAIIDSNKYAFRIGGGIDADNREDILTVDWDGNLNVKGNLINSNGSLECDSIILRSTNKKFRITIDDNGELSAEEVTE